MTAAIDLKKPKRVRTGAAGAFFLAVMLLCAMLTGACASGTGSQSPGADERKAPPAVSDQSLRPRVGDQTAFRPRVHATVEAEPGAQLETKGATKFVQRDGRRCYRLALQKNRALEGEALYEVVVTSNGRVGGVEKMSSSVSSNRLDRCITSMLRRLRFDIPSNSTAMVRRLYIKFELSRDAFDPNKPPINPQGP